MKDNRYTDEELVAMIGGDRSQREIAIRLLMREELQTKRVTGHLLKLGATPEECEEIIDDAFVALITSIAKGRFQSGRSVWAYLYGAARNILYKLRRGDKFKDTIPVSATVIEDTEDSVETHIIKVERREWLMSVFRKLAEKCRNILHLAFFEERSNQEIADELNYKSKAVVGVKKSECLKRLAALLKDAKKAIN